MKVSSLILAVGLISLTAPSFAQSKFEGFYGQVGIGYEGINPSLTNSPLVISGANTGTIPLSTSASTTSGATGNVAVGYTAAVNKDFTLALGVEYYPVNSQSGNFSATALGNTFNGTYQKQNVYNIYLAPGMNIGKDGLGYFKVGYTSSSVKYTLQSDTSTDTLTGYSLGLGYKQFFMGNWYGFGEVNYFTYGNLTSTSKAQVSGTAASLSTTFSANVYNLLVGIGYKFQ